MIKLYTPKLEELKYREHLLKDIETMKYNSGYDLGLEYYDRETGCLNFSDKYHKDWYNRWFNTSNRYYGYILDEDKNVFVGEVSFRYDNSLDGYMIGIIIESIYRGKGYSTKALIALCEKAFNEYDAKTLYDDIPSSREAAIKLFKKVGFKIDKVYYQNKFDDKEEIYLMKLEKAKDK